MENQPIFDGWDADVILHDTKVAVLWNGAWHYQDIKGGLKQIQSRDKIKSEKILSRGYRLVIIKDMGKENKQFIELMFEKFKEINFLEIDGIIHLE